jgi:hypothetical protein
MHGGPQGDDRYSSQLSQLLQRLEARVAPITLNRQQRAGLHHQINQAVPAGVVHRIFLADQVLREAAQQQPIDRLMKRPGRATRPWSNLRNRQEYVIDEVW